MASLQINPITFLSSSSTTSTTQIHPNSSTLSLSTSFLPLPKLSTTHLRRKPTTPSKSHGPKMNDSAASSYATALLEVSKSNNTLDETQSDIEKIERFFDDKNVYEFFNNPTIGIEKKRGFIDEIAKSAELKPHVANFLNILIDMKRIDLIKEIVKEFEIVYNRLTNTEMVTVTSVVKLESEHLAQIAKGVQKLTGAKNVRIKTAIDPSLVAGFTIRYGSTGSKVIDMSVKKQLEEITAQLDIGDIQLAV